MSSNTINDQLILVRNVSKETIQSLAEIYAKSYSSKDEMQRQNVLTQMFMSNQNFKKVVEIATNIQEGKYGTQLKMSF